MSRLALKLILNLDMSGHLIKRSDSNWLIICRYRTSEPQGLVEREKSLILDKIFSTMRAKGIKRGEILDQLSLPLDEISTLTFNNNFFMEAIEGSGNNVTLKPKDTFLKLVK
ncbi:hypothetical protein V2A85_19620 [Yersinia sp. 1252 StPb PI]|uniref:hypothetical protein n=1 Tax=Yersinia sp. 1252 StPb PI TaxID=3117404 RepID=UPI003B28269C